MRPRNVILFLHAKKILHGPAWSCHQPCPFHHVSFMAHLHVVLRRPQLSSSWFPSNPEKACSPVPLMTRCDCFFCPCMSSPLHASCSFLSTQNHSCTPWRRVCCTQQKLPSSSYERNCYGEFPKDMWSIRNIIWWKQRGNMQYSWYGRFEFWSRAWPKVG